MNDVVRNYPVSGDLNISDAQRTSAARCYRAGAQAKLDTMRGLIRVRVVEVARDCKGWVHGTAGEIVVRVLETRVPARCTDERRRALGARAARAARRAPGPRGRLRCFSLPFHFQQGESTDERDQG